VPQPTPLPRPPLHRFIIKSLFMCILNYFTLSLLLHLAFRRFTKYHTATNALIVYHISIIGIQPLGRSGQRPELSQATGMALVRCILGNFLGVACHCFPPLFRCSHFLPPGASTSGISYISLKLFTLKHFQCSYMFRRHIAYHHQGALIVPS